MTVADLKKSLGKKGSKKKAAVMRRFFKTGKGEYGEGDTFIGVDSHTMRKIAKQFFLLPHAEVLKLLHSPIHEHRQTALFIWIHQFEKGDEKMRQRIYTDYLKSTRWINNWDLVDSTAPRIVGVWLLHRSRKPLYVYAKGGNLWEKRIAIISTFTFIRNKDFADTFRIAKILLADQHDLIRKAVGWMLREVGNQNRKAEEVFLRTYAATMPRTMLRYAIEKFPENMRKRYLKMGR